MKKPASKESDIFTFGFPHLPQLGEEPGAFGANAVRMASFPVEFWLRCQDAFLSAAAPMGEDWVKRRRAGTAAALDAVEKMRGCEDMASVARIQREWMEGAMQRLAEDAQAMAEQTFKLSQQAINAGQAAAEAAAEGEIEPTRKAEKAA